MSPTVTAGDIDLRRHALDGMELYGRLLDVTAMFSGAMMILPVR